MPSTAASPAVISISPACLALVWKFNSFTATPFLKTLPAFYLLPTLVRFSPHHTTTVLPRHTHSEGTYNRLRLTYLHTVTVRFCTTTCFARYWLLRSPACTTTMATCGCWFTCTTTYRAARILRSSAGSPLVPGARHAFTYLLPAYTAHVLRILHAAVTYGDLDTLSSLLYRCCRLDRYTCTPPPLTGSAIPCCHAVGARALYYRFW